MISGGRRKLHILFFKVSLMQLPIGWWRQWPLGGACLSQGDYAALDPPKQRDSTSRTRSPCEAGFTTTLEKWSGSVQWKGNPERKKYDFAQRVNVQMIDH